MFCLRCFVSLLLVFFSLHNNRSICLEVRSFSFSSLMLTSEKFIVSFSPSGLLASLLCGCLRIFCSSTAVDSFLRKFWRA